MLDDLKFAVRRLRNSPGFAVAAVVTLALAIGANAAVFSVADAVLFRPLPYEDADRVRILQMAHRKTGARATLVSYPLFHAIADHHTGVGPVGEVEDVRAAVIPTADGADVVPVVAVSANYFEILGVRAARGRSITGADAQQPGRPAMLSWAAWRQRFGGDDSVVGRPLTVGSQTFDIVGVLPAGFVFPSLFVGGLPAHLVTLLEPSGPGSRGGTFHPIVRLEPGVTDERAQAEMDALVAPLITGPGSEYTVVLEDVRSVIYPAGAAIMRFLLAAAGLVLLLGCANLANLLLARARRRERETGVRAALGASRGRLVRPVVLESLLIGVAGAALALAVTYLSFDALIRQMPRIAYGAAPVGVDLRVALFTLALGILSGLAFAVVPAWRSSSADVQVLLQAHRHGVRYRGALGRPMIAVQVALAVVITFGALIAARAFLAVLNIPLGFTPDDVVTVRLWPPEGMPAQAFYVRALDTVFRRPEVVSAGAIASMPLDSRAPDESVKYEGGTRMVAGISHALPGYFETIGIRRVRGRLLEWDDVRAGADVAVVSEAAAKALFPGRDPLGETFTSGRGRRFTVVGVVSDVLKSHDWPAEPPVYVLGGESVRLMTIVARVGPGVRRDAFLTEIRREIARLAPGRSITAVWWSDAIARLTAYRNPRFQTIVLGGFAVLALGLTTIGVFAIVAFLVAIRTREMGIRLAIGASPGSLISLIIRQACVPVVVGLMAGLLATRWLARLAEAQLFAVETRDPLTLVAAAVTVVVAALVAAYLPARHASRVDPIMVLRAE